MFFFSTSIRLFVFGVIEVLSLLYVIFTISLSFCDTFFFCVVYSSSLFHVNCHALCTLRRQVSCHLSPKCGLDFRKADVLLEHLHQQHLRDYMQLWADSTFALKPNAQQVPGSFFSQMWKNFGFGCVKVIFTRKPGSKKTIRMGQVINHMKAHTVLTRSTFKKKN